MGLYKENNSSHNSPSERITAAQESVALLGFPDTDDTFLTRVEVPIHFSGDLFRSAFVASVSVLVLRAAPYVDVCESSLQTPSTLFAR
jgi:hypothetical protein